VNDIHCGDATETLAEMPADSVHCVMTSPPYYGLRNYQEDEQIGLEDSLEEYIAELVAVGEELKRVLRPDGSWWLNLGDSYGGSRGNHTTGDAVGGAPDADYHSRDGTRLGRKNKMLVPHRVAIALQEAGWVVRNDVTWVKPNPMPSSVKDRLNTTTEQVFHLTPEPDYWYDLDAIREPHAEASHERANSSSPIKTTSEEYLNQAHAQSGGVNEDAGLHPAGKNPGDVFEVTTKPFPEAHFAVYPPELCEKPIKATAPPKVCADCGAPYIRESINTGLLTNPTGRKQKARAIEMFEQSDLTRDHLSALRSVGVTDAGQAQEVYDGHGRNRDEVERRAAEAKNVLGGYAREFLGRETASTEWVRGCDCDTDATEPAIVCDPFAGAGTTCLVAKRLGRRFIGVDLNPEYVAMAQKRVGVTVDEPERLLAEDETALSAFTDGDDT